MNRRGDITRSRDYFDAGKHSQSQAESAIIIASLLHDLLDWLEALDTPPEQEAGDEAPK